jgi:hypothetical protein
MLNFIYQFLESCPAWLFWGGLGCVMAITFILTCAATRRLIRAVRRFLANFAQSLVAQEEVSENEQWRWE